ncbi:MAG: SpoIID/LytB domain-containing protein, partial [Angustibacter sp.]
MRLSRSLVLTTVLIAATPIAITPPATAATASAAVCPSPGGARITEAAAPSGAQVVVRGHGWGHSLGMSQYGAQGAARLGCTYDQILRTYFRGTSVGTRTLNAGVDVLLLSDGTRATVTATASLPWRGANGRSATQPAGATWSVAQSGSAAFLRDSSGRAVFSASSGDLIWAEPGGSAARVRSYAGSVLVTDKQVGRGQVRLTPSSSGLDVSVALRTGSVPAVQQYLWGLAEVPASWPVHALRAQAVAARTYLARRYSSTRGSYVVWATTRDQNYGGAVMEAQDAASGGRWRAAVDDTQGRLVVDSAGHAIDALYSSSHGGRSEDARYVFGGSGAAHLVSFDDSRWDLASDNPFRSWASGFSAADVAERLDM